MLQIVIQKDIEGFRTKMLSYISMTYNIYNI